MKKNGLKKISTTMALFGLALILVLAGCEESGNGNDKKKKDPVITGVTLSSPANPGVVFAGQGGDLTYSIKIDGANITTVDLAGSDVIIGTKSGDTVTAMPGLSLKDTVEVNKTESIKITVDDTLAADTYQIAISVKGKASNEVSLTVLEPSPITSVVVEPADNPGEAIAGTTGYLHFTITIQGNQGVVFPINLKDEAVVRFNMENGEPLPKEIEIEETENITDFNTPANISFKLVVQPGKPGTYNLIAYVHNFPSDPFELVVQPSVLGGDVQISEDNGTLTADTEYLDGDDDDENQVISYQWKRSADNKTFENIQNANSASYTITPADYDRYITVEVSRGGYSGTVTADSLYILDPNNPPLSGTVNITGEAKIGRKLTAVLSNFPSGAVPIFEWHRITGSSSTVAHSGIDENEYEVSEHDADHKLVVYVTSQGYGTRLESIPTATVPYLTTAEQFEVLSAMAVKPSSYTVTVREDETLAAQTLNFGTTVINITVKSLVGEAKTLTMASPSAALFTIPANQSNVTLTLENVVLKGLEYNNNPIINNISGTVNMNEGTLITGNNNPSNIGGGVINRGTFNMHGGSITGNKGSWAGGVANYGTFNMYDGLITLNIAGDSNSEGGGVWVTGAAGKFYMYGGEISHNTADYGGAVSVSESGSGGVFAMIGGSISANHANFDSSGALCINSGGSFLLESGIIHGSNFETPSLINDGGKDRAVLSLFNGTAQLVKFNPAYSSYDVKGQLVETELTLHAKDGVLLRPIYALAMVVTGINNPEFIGKTGHLTVRIGSNWNVIADPVTVTASTRFEFNTPQVPAEREFRLEFRDGSALVGRYEKAITLALGDTTIALSGLDNQTPTSVTSISFRGLPWTGNSLRLEDFANSTPALGSGMPYSDGSITFNVALTPGRYTLNLVQVSNAANLLRFDCILGLGENIISYSELIRISITDLPKPGIMRLYNEDTGAIVCNRFTVGDVGLRFDYAVDANILPPGHYNLALKIINTTTNEPTETVGVFPCELRAGANIMSYKDLFPVTSITITGLPSELTGNLELWNKDTDVKIAAAAVSGSSVTFVPVGMVADKYKLSLKKEGVTDPIVSEFTMELKGGANTTTYLDITFIPAVPSIPMILEEWVEGNIPSSATPREQWFRFTAPASRPYTVEFRLGTMTDYYFQMYESNATTTFGSQHNAYSGYLSITRTLVGGNTYYIKIYPYSSQSGTFSFRFHDPFASVESTAIQLTADTWVAGTMPMEGDHWYKFTATAERQYIHIEFGTFNYVDIRLYTLSFAEYGSTNFIGGPNVESGTRVEIMRTITVGTTYYIRVKPFNAEYYGTYRIMFNDPFAAVPAAATPLTADTWANGDLPAGGVHWYKFTATAATQYLHFTYGTMAIMKVQLFNPNFSTTGVEADLFGMKAINRDLTVGTTYYVRVTPYSSSDSGTYQIKFNTKPFETAVPLAAAGVWADQEIKMFGGEQWFSFTATAAAQFVHVGFGTLTSLNIQLYDNNLNPVVNQANLTSSSAAQYITGSLTVGNEYYVRITAGSGSRGTYKLLYNNMSVTELPTATALTESVAESGDMPSTGDRENWYSFQATASRQFIHVIFGTFNDMYIQVYDDSYNPVGERTRLYSSTTYISRTVISGNTYYVRITPYSTGSGAYQILFNQMALLAVPSGITPLAEGIWANGSMPTAATENWYSFTATIATQYMYIEFGTCKDLFFQMYDSAFVPSGDQYNMYGSRIEVSRPVNIGETYYIKILPYNASNTGDYKIRIFNPFAGASAATQLTAGAWANGDMPASGEQWYKFTATAATQYAHVEFGTLADMYIQLYTDGFGAVGSETRLNGTTININRPLTVGNLYYIRIKPYGTASGTYKILFNNMSVAVIPSSTLLTENVWADGTMPSSGEQWYRFTATAGMHRVQVEFGELTNMYMQLFNSDFGAVGAETSLYGSTTSIDRQVTLGNTYYVKIRPNGSSQSGTYRIMFSSISVTPITEGVWAAGAVLTANAVNWFSFTATASPQHIYFALGPKVSNSSSLADLHVRVYDSNSTEVGSQDNPYSTSTHNISRPVTVGQTYYIRVIPYNNNAGDGGPFHVTIGASVAARPPAPPAAP